MFYKILDVELIAY